MKNLTVVENHHQVLLPWAAARRAAGVAPAVFTLDHHTDVLPAFGRMFEGRDEKERLRRIAGFDWRSDADVRAAIADLRHDEHFDLALRSGMIASARIVAQENFTPPAHPAMTVCVAPGWPDGDVMLNDPARCRPWADRVLESDFLAQFPAPEAPYILDIDLDYLMTARAAAPRDATLFRRYAEQAEWVTVSLERDWVRLLRLAGETVDSDGLLRLLLQAIGAYSVEVSTMK